MDGYTNENVAARRDRLRRALESVPMPASSSIFISEATAAQLDITIDEIADRVATKLANANRETR